PEKVEMPPGAAELAIGRELQSDFFLLPDDLFDLAVFDSVERSGIDFVPRTLGAGFLERCGSQQAADMVGAEWRSFSLCHRSLTSPTLRSPTPQSSVAWPIVLSRRAHCPPRSKQTRIAETGRVGRAPHIWWPLRSAFSLRRAARDVRSSTSPGRARPSSCLSAGNAAAQSRPRDRSRIRENIHRSCISRAGSQPPVRSRPRK